MDIYNEIDLQDCPYCGGTGCLEEEDGWCWYVVCMDCGSHSAEASYSSPHERIAAAKSAAFTWNMGKVIRGDIGE